MHHTAYEITTSQGPVPTLHMLVSEKQKSAKTVRVVGDVNGLHGR